MLRELPLLFEDGVADRVQPAAGSVQRLADRVQFAAHADALHEAPRGVVAEEAVRGDPAHAEVLEAVAEELAHGLGGVAVAGVGGIEDPAELRLRVAGPSATQLGPGVLAAEHEVADDRGRDVLAEGDDDGGRETGRLREQLAVAVEVGGAAGEPLVDGLEPAEPPGRLGVVGGGGTEGEALGVQRALEHRGSGRCIPGAELGDDRADVAQAGEYPVKLRLVGDLDGDRGGAVVVAGHVEPAEPGRPVVVEVAFDADRVRRRGGVHESAPAC